MIVRMALATTSTAILLGAVTACGSQSTQDASTVATDAESGKHSPTPVLGANVELDADAPPVPEDKTALLWANLIWDGATLDLPDQLADAPDVKLIVAGTIESIELGPILFAATVEDPQAEQQIVIGLRVTDTMKGEAPASGIAYVQLDGNKPLEEYRAGLPLGTVAGLYLEEAPQANGKLIVGDEDAGRPKGEPVWQVGPQGFVVADGRDGGVVFPYGSEIAPSKDFDSQLPRPAE